MKSRLSQRICAFRNSLIFRQKICHLPLVAFLIFSAGLSAQPAIQFDKTQGGSATEFFSTVKQTSDGGYIMAGSSNSPISGDKSEASKGGQDYWVVKFGSNGAKQWDKTFGGSQEDRLVQVFQTSDNGYVLVGHSLSDSGGDKGQNDKAAGGGSRGDYWIVKISDSGVKQWDKTIGGTSADVLDDAKQTTDGGYILLGYSISGAGADKTAASLGGRDFWVVKISGDGSIQWDKTLGTSGADRFGCIDNAAGGGYILGGGSRIPESNNPDSFVARLSENGTVLWSKTLGLPDSEVVDIIQTSGGEYLLAIKQNESFVGIPYRILKMDNQGTEIWRKSFAGGSAASSAFDEPTVVRQTTDGGFIIGGFSGEQAGRDKSENPKGSHDYWIVKTDATGIKQWDKTIGGSSFDQFYSIELASDGGYFLGGSSYSPQGFDKSEPLKGAMDYWIVRLAAETASAKLSFSDADLDFTVVAGSSAPAQSVTLTANTGTPVVTLTKSANSAWLTLPAASPGSLSFSVDATGLAPGNYTAQVTASAPGYESATLDVELIVKAVNDPVTVRIDAGGQGLTTSDGRVFGADQFYGGINRTFAIPSGEVLYTADDLLYRNERSAESFNYNIPVTDGAYVVVLHFAEIWFGSPQGGRPGGIGQRMFNVDIEGSRKLDNYDIYAKANGALTAVEEEFRVSVTDGFLNIDFSQGAANLPTVAAIEVVPEAEYFKSVHTLPVIADAYVHTNFKDENFGTEDLLIVKSGEENISRQTYLKFDLGGFAQVTSARLRIYGNNVETTMKVNTTAYSVENDSWTETGITYNNAPASGFEPLTHTTVNDDIGYHDIDLTGFVQTQAADDKVVSVMLKNPTFVNRKLVFHSKENASGLAPELVVTTHSPVGTGARMASAVVPENISSIIEKGGSTVYPNPVRDHFSLKLSSRHEGPVSLYLIDQSGRGRNLAVSQNTSRGSEVDISDLSLSSGIYMLKVRSEAETEVLKVLVIE